MNLSLIKWYHYMNSQQLYYIIIPMRFLNFLFILYWLLKDKNNFNIHIPYTDTQSTHWCTYIHTTINTHKYNLGRWQKVTYLTHDILPIQVFPQMPQYNRYTYKLQRMCEPSRPKETLLYVQVTCCIPCSLLLHTSQQTAMQIQVFTDILSTCNEPTAKRCSL